MALTSLSTDIYLPVMPQMKRELHADVELTITGLRQWHSMDDELDYCHLRCSGIPDDRTFSTEKISWQGIEQYFSSSSS